MDDGFGARNDTARKRLRATVPALTDGLLEAPLADGWTVQAVLAHLAWWDRYAVSLLSNWMMAECEADISTPPMRGGRFASDYDNAAGLADWLALPADFVRGEVLRAADEADAVAAAVAARLARAGQLTRLARYGAPAAVKSRPMPSRRARRR